MIKIGIIGKGFVGKAVKYGFSSLKNCEIKVYDKDPEKSEHTLSEVVNDSDYLFVSVPTPSNLDGSINLEIVDLCLNEIDKVNLSEPIILLRSRTFKEIVNSGEWGGPDFFIVLYSGSFLYIC